MSYVGVRVVEKLTCISNVDTVMGLVSLQGLYMLTQLDPPIPLHHLTKGNGYAIAVIDYSQEHHLHWVVGFDDTGEIWVCANTDVRLQFNQTLKRVPSKHYMADLELRHVNV